MPKLQHTHLYSLILEANGYSRAAQIYINTIRDFANSSHVNDLGRRVILNNLEGLEMHLNKQHDYLKDVADEALQRSLTNEKTNP